MTVIELVIAAVLLVAAAAVVNTVASIPAATKRILNTGVGVLLAVLILVFVLSLLGIGLHRRI